MSTAGGDAPTPVIVAGAGGRMGRLALGWVAGAPDLALVAELRRGDDAHAAFTAHPDAALLDLTVAASSVPLVERALTAGLHPVIGTSGWSDAQLDALERRCTELRRGALWIPNFSVGAVLQMRFAAEAARVLRPLGIEEAHHPGKRDAPSGTARATASRMAAAARGEPPPIRSERRADVLAEQRVTLGGEHERLELLHRVSDRAAYAPGVLLALRRVRTLDRLVRGLDPLL